MDLFSLNLQEDKELWAGKSEDEASVSDRQRLEKARWSDPEVAASQPACQATSTKSHMSFVIRAAELFPSSVARLSSFVPSYDV